MSEEEKALTKREMELAQSGWMAPKRTGRYSDEEIEARIKGLSEAAKPHFRAVMRYLIEAPEGRTGWDYEGGGPFSIKRLKADHYSGYLKMIDEQFGRELGITAGESEIAAFLDDKLPNWRYLISPASGQLDRFKSLSKIWGAIERCREAGTDNIFEGIIAGRLLPRNLADIYALDPDLAGTAPKDLLKSSGRSSFIEAAEKRESELKLKQFLYLAVSIIAEHLDPKEKQELVAAFKAMVSGIKSKEDFSKVLERARGKAVMNVLNGLTLEKFRKLSEEERQKFEVLGIPRAIPLQALMHTRLMADIKRILLVNGLKAGDGKTESEAMSVISSGLKELLTIHGISNDAEIISLDEELAGKLTQIEEKKASQIASGLKTEVSPRDLKLQDLIISLDSLPLKQLRHAPGLEKQVVAILDKRTFLADALRSKNYRSAAFGGAIGTGLYRLRGLSDSEYESVLAEAIAALLKEGGFPADNSGKKVLDTRTARILLDYQKKLSPKTKAGPPPQAAPLYANSDKK